MIATIMVIVLMDHADVNQDTVELIALQDHVQMTVQEEEVAANMFVNVMKDTWDLIAR
jgi:hypothetical protein